MTSNEISTTTTMTTRLKRKKTAQQLLPSPMNQITDTTLNVHQKIDLCLTNEPRSIAFFVTSVPTTIEWVSNTTKSIHKHTYTVVDLPNLFFFFVKCRIGQLLKQIN